MKFYTFTQNNSGGKFIINDELTTHVIVEANTAAEANNIAESKGIYFDGCEKDMDCPCCGDRWYECRESDGTDIPTLYGEKAHDFKGRKWVKVFCHIYYANGTKETLTETAP